MRNFIGNLLIGLAAFISFLRNVIFFIIVAGFCLGILLITVIAFFELVGRTLPAQEVPMPFELFGKWYWELIVVFLGGATMWQGFKKMFEADKKETKLLDGWNENPKYHGNP